MPQWAGSCWYYLRYIDPTNNKKLIKLKLEEKTMPVDLYVGGAEHAVLHLLYARFWHKFLFDIGISNHKEPFKKLVNVGLILAPDRQKMSKSRGNVINPDELVNSYGADALRMYELFIGPFEKQAVWDRKGITGTYNFLVKIIKKFESRKKNQKDFSVDLSKLSKKVSDKIESFNLNTIVSDFMKFSNSIDLSEMSTDNWKKFLICLSPLAPHTSEYLFNKIEKSKSIFKQKWPEYSLDKKDKSDIIVQVNGKKKDIIFVTPNTTKSSIIKKALKKISDRTKKDDIIKIIYIENKVVNFVTKRKENNGRTQEEANKN